MSYVPDGETAVKKRPAPTLMDYSKQLITQLMYDTTLAGTWHMGQVGKVQIRESSFEVLSWILMAE